MEREEQGRLVHGDGRDDSLWTHLEEVSLLLLESSLSESILEAVF